MAWFKVDDGFATSPKVLRIPRAQRLAAVGLWTLAGTWCARHLTDGRVPAFMLEEFGADVSHGTALVDVGLWVRTDDGYAFHAWSEYQPSRADVSAHRESERQRKEEWRRKKAENRENKGQSPEGVPASVTAGQTDVSRLTRPDPTHPDPTRPDQLKRESAAARGTRLPDDFFVTGEMVEWARENAPLVDGRRSTERFKNHFAAVSGQKGVKRDWVRTWKNWLLKDQEEAERRPGPKQSTVDHGRSVDDILRARESGHLKAVTA